MIRSIKISVFALHDITIFRLSAQAIEVLQDFIGVVAFEDLALIYLDDRILEDLQNLLKRLDYVKFMNAKEATLQMLANQYQPPSPQKTPSKPAAGEGEFPDTEVLAIPEISLNESIDDILADSETIVKAVCPVIPSADSKLFSDEELNEATIGEPVVAVPVANVIYEEEIHELESRNNQLSSLINIIDDEISRRKEARISNQFDNICCHCFPNYLNFVTDGSPDRIPRAVEAPLPPPPPPRPDISDLRKFLLSPITTELGTVLCSFVRNRIGDHRHNPSYTVFLEVSEFTVNLFVVISLR